jgi:hypothetical protein
MIAMVASYGSAQSPTGASVSVQNSHRPESSASVQSKASQVSGSGKTDIPSDRLTKLVVKQVVAAAIAPPGGCQISEGTGNEVTAYTILNEAKSKHIVRMYRRMHDDFGAGSGLPRNFYGDLIRFVN